MVLFSFEKQQCLRLTGLGKPTGLSGPIGGPILATATFDLGSVAIHFKTAGPLQMNAG